MAVLFSYRAWLVILVMLGNISSAWGTTYFVDATQGRDSNKGTSPSSAWKTLRQVNEYQFHPGDDIQFKRGEVYQGRLDLHPKSEGESGQPITFTTFGEGSLPIVTSKRTLGRFESAGPNRWVIPLEGRSQRRHVLIARRLSDGFVFRNVKDSPEEVRQEGDLFHDRSHRDSDRHRLYLYARNNPSNDIEVPTDNILFLAKNSWIDVDSIHFDFSNGQAILTKSPASHLNFRKIEVTNTGKAAHSTSGKIIRYVTFDRALFHHNNGHGIQINGKGKNRDFWTIQDSEFHHNCLDTHDTNEDIQTNAFCAAIKGITQHGSGNQFLVEGNHVHHNGNTGQQSKRINKGVGIWIDTWESGQAVVRRNTVHHNILAGIELELTLKQTVEGNLVYRNGQGVPHIDYLNGECGISVNRGSHGNLIKNNSVYDNNGFQLCLVGPRRSGRFSNHNLVQGNLLIPKNPSQACLLVHGRKLTDINENKFESNNCGRPQANFIRWGVNPGPSNNPSRIPGFHTYQDWINQYRKDTGRMPKDMKASEYTLPTSEPTAKNGDRKR